MYHAMTSTWALLRKTFEEWNEDKVPRLGAALAFYTALSIAPLLVITLRTAAFFFGDEAARGEIERQTRDLIGEQGATAIQAMIENASKPETGLTATILSVATLLFGASGVFGQLQDSLNTIWEVKPKPGRGVVGFLQDRFASFAMVMGIAFLLLVSLVLSAVLSFLGDYFSGTVFAFNLFGGQILNFVVSTGLFTVLFALMFKLLPDAKMAWRDVWLGGAVTAVLFSIGKVIIGLYLGHSSMASAYGVAGSFVVFLVWVYYSAQILFFGAELTQVYANKYGQHVVPTPNAVSVTEETRAQEGLTRLEPAAER